MPTQTTKSSTPVQTWLAGFVYRGRAPFETEPAAYHIEIGQYLEVQGLDPVRLTTLVMTPDAAQAAGYTLPDLLSTINADALAELTSLRAQVLDLAAHNTALIDALSKAEKERDEASANLEALKASFAERQATASS